MHRKRNTISILPKAVIKGCYSVIEAMLNTNMISNGEIAIALRNSITSGQTEQVKLLIEHCRQHHLKLNISNQLCQAIRLEFDDIVQELLAAGADPNAIDFRGSSPLMAAVQTQNMPLVKSLLEMGADATFIDRSGCTLAAKAASCPSTAILEAVLQHGSEIQGALFHAVLHNQYANARYLLLRGADVNERNKQGTTPMIAAVLHENYTMIKLLVNREADLNLQDYHGDTVLMIAARHGRSRLFRHLVGLGASTVITNKFGETAYDIVLKHCRTIFTVKDDT